MTGNQGQFKIVPLVGYSLAQSAIFCTCTCTKDNKLHTERVTQRVCRFYSIIDVIKTLKAVSCLGWLQQEVSL